MYKPIVFTFGGFVYVAISDTTVMLIGRDGDLDCGILEVPRFVTNGEKKFAVTRIGFKAFFECNYEYIEANHIEHIDKYAFANSPKLVIVELKWCYKIEEFAFTSCPSLVKVLDAKHVNALGSCAFSGCPNLEVVELEKCLDYVGTNVFQGSSKVKISYEQYQKRDLYSIYLQR